MNILGEKQKNPAQTRANPKKPARLRWFSVLLVCMLCCFFCFPALAEAPGEAPEKSGGFPDGFGDEAFDIATTQMVSLLEYADMFKPGENTSCSMMQGGTHTLDAVYTYLYHILPALFAGYQ